MPQEKSPRLERVGETIGRVLKPILIEAAFGGPSSYERMLESQDRRSLIYPFHYLASQEARKISY